MHKGIAGEKGEQETEGALSFRLFALVEDELQISLEKTKGLVRGGSAQKPKLLTICDYAPRHIAGRKCAMNDLGDR